MHMHTHTHIYMYTTHIHANTVQSFPRLQIDGDLHEVSGDIRERYPEAGRRQRIIL